MSGRTIDPRRIEVVDDKVARILRGMSERHLRDIAGMLRVSGAEIDTGYIDDWAQRLGLGDTWQAVRERGEST